jgi:hypothetical protein
MKYPPPVDVVARQDLPFEREAAVVLEELRPALAGVLECLRPPVPRAADLHRLLGLDRKLSWSVFNAATAHDARELASLLPGKRAMERFFAAAGHHGASVEAIARARAAFERFEAAVARHAPTGRRDDFETMLATIGDDGESNASEAEIKHKRSIFRGASLIWGRQAQVVLHSMIVHPSAMTAGQRLLDIAVIRGMIGLHQTRRGVPLHTIIDHRYWRHEGDPSGPVPLRAIDPRESSPDAVGLLRDFCSQPAPTFRTEVKEEGAITHELIASGLGASAQATYFTGWVLRACAAECGSGDDPFLEQFGAMATPVEVGIVDALLHESVWGTGLPEVSVYTFPLHGTQTEFRSIDLLPLTGKARLLGRGLDSGRTPLIPRYVEMMSYAVEQLGWDPSEFRIFRCHMEYPVVQSRIRMTFWR